MAAAGTLRQLLLPAISRRLAAGSAAFTGNTTSTMAQIRIHPSVNSEGCVRSYMTDAAALQQRRE
jgi:hypothetical protein